MQCFCSSILNGMRFMSPFWILTVGLTMEINSKAIFELSSANTYNRKFRGGNVEVPPISNNAPCGV